jgi:hypothetical protein
MNALERNDNFHDCNERTFFPSQNGNFPQDDSFI